MIYEYPERKIYNYVINTTKWPLNIRLRQATANDTKDFYTLIEEVGKWDREKIKELNDYYISLIKNWIERWKWWQIRKNIKKTQLRLLVKRELASYIQEVIQYTHQQRESVYKNTETPKIDWKSPRGSMFTNEKEVIYEKTGIPTNKIYDELTMEQIWWYLDKIVFSTYESFEEWRKINDKLMRAKNKWWLTKEDKEDLEFIKSQKL